jgi:signal transduction histidine kinase/CheY-like chemotaxis protein/HAMP domain-containing protein
MRQAYLGNAISDYYGLRVMNLSKGYLLEGGDFMEVVSEIRKNYFENVRSFYENLISYRDIMLSDARLTEAERNQRLSALDDFESSFRNYLELASNIDSAVERKDKQEVIRLYAEGIPMGNNLSRKMFTFRDMLYDTTKQKALDAANQTEGVIRVTAAVTAGFILLSALALLFTARNINQPILELEKGVSEIAKGNLAYPIRSSRGDEFGTLSNRVGDMVDKITEQNTEQTKIMTVLDNLDSMICISDLEYNLLFVNKRLADTFSLDRDNLYGKKCYGATRNKDRPCSFCQMPDLLPLKDSFPVKDYEYMWDDVFNAWIGGTDSIIRWVDGSSVFLRCIRNVSQKKKQEEMLHEALISAEKASAAKSSFLANMSHEIRTPMNAILGITEILLHDEAQNSNTKEALNKIYSSGDLLLHIINDILDLSKIDAGKLELEPANYDVPSLINDTVTLNMMRIGGKPLEFELQVDENIPGTLFGDELRIKQILNNLLSNSFKYTKKGLVKFAVSAEVDEADKTVTLVFNVSDTGQGMSKEQVSMLFEEYSRFNMEANRSIEGTGLGMSITQHLIQMMNGSISVKSELNWGSVFTVQLPQKDTGSGVIGREVAENLQKFEVNVANQIKRSQVVFEPMPYGSILVVDDVETNLYVAQGLLAPYGLSFDTAGSGYEALDKVKAGKVYDIIFMDHMMPKMDGIETTEKIRNLGYTRPIVALTANAVTGQSEIFLSNGLDDFISKPIDVRQMDAMLKKFIKDKQSPEVIEAARHHKNSHEEHAAAAQLVTIPAMLLANQKLAEVFVKSATKIIDALESLQEKYGDKGNDYEEDDIRMYIINVHGIKGALANIGEKELSALAAKLEKAGKEKDIAVIEAETGELVNGLQAMIRELTQKKE